MMPLCTNTDGMKVTLKLFGKAWRDRMPAPDGTLPDRLEWALQRLAAMDDDTTEAERSKPVDAGA